MNSAHTKLSSISYLYRSRIICSEKMSPYVMIILHIKYKFPSDTLRRSGWFFFCIYIEEEELIIMLDDIA